MKSRVRIHFFGYLVVGLLIAVDCAQATSLKERNYQIIGNAQYNDKRRLNMQESSFEVNDLDKRSFHNKHAAHQQQHGNHHHSHKFEEKMSDSPIKDAVAITDTTKIDANEISAKPADTTKSSTTSTSVPKSIPTATGGFVYTLLVFLSGVAVIGNAAFLIYVFLLSK